MMKTWLLILYIGTITEVQRIPQGEYVSLGECRRQGQILESKIRTHDLAEGIQFTYRCLPPDPVPNNTG